MPILPYIIYARVWEGRLFQPNAWSSTILIDEFDTGSFESTPDDIERRAARLMQAGF